MKEIIEKGTYEMNLFKNFFVSQYPGVPMLFIWKERRKKVASILRGILFGQGIKSGKRLKIGKSVRLDLKSQMSFGDSVSIGGNSIVNALSKEGITIGNHSRIGEFSTLKVTWVLSDLGKGLSIGNNSSFGEYCFFGAAGGIEIGDDVIAGQNVRFHSENHIFSDTSILIRLQGVERKGIKIGSNIWIGAGAVFLDGARLGDNCVVAANSVVQKEFPDNCVIGGVPARILKRL